ncbi:unnamed protein product [Clonostachys rhizophaga]|uniref:Uncharacterized protein n=1 Tax=Clonostachys rhizophaga TaxID=160324 RepID=A0A9N9VEP0_9HYPO|nr:unnamed protein product [Clonostachys rhizophaga]
MYGLSETHVDAMMFIYWIAAIFIQMILEGKANRPTATREEIAFGILDAWDCFIVPWMGNIFRASVCKAKEHGLTMVTGILDPEGQPFDPVPISISLNATSGSAHK